MKLYCLNLILCITYPTLQAMQQAHVSSTGGPLIAVASVLYPITPHSIYCRYLQHPHRHSFNDTDNTVREAALILEQLRTRSQSLAHQQSSHDSQEPQMIIKIIITPPEESTCNQNRRGK